MVGRYCKDQEASAHVLLYLFCSMSISVPYCARDLNHCKLPKYFAKVKSRYFVP